MDYEHHRWPVKGPAAIVRYEEWLNDLVRCDQALPVQASFTASPSGTGELTYSNLTVDARLLTVLLAGGVASRDYLGWLTLYLSDGSVVEKFVSIPVSRHTATWPIPEPPSYLPGTPVTWVLSLTSSVISQLIGFGRVAFLPFTDENLPVNVMWNNAGAIMVTAGSTCLPTSDVGLAPGTPWSNGGQICFAGGVSALPSSPNGLPAWMLWNDNGTLAIVSPPGAYPAPILLA